MLTLFPEIEPYNSFHLDVSDIHQIYVEESGNPDGIPVLFVHGGPGSGAGAKDRRFFDPKQYRIIIFDQRGAGRSLPYADLRENTTAHLMSDMETIRKHLNINQWVLFGGSWGSTLSLAYAQKRPSRVMALVLRGIFLCTQAEFDWLYGPNGTAQIFPDDYEAFIAPVPEEKRHTIMDILEAYYELLTTNDLEAARAWSVWEGKTCTLLRDQSRVDFYADHAAAIARIECHYFLNGGFLKRDQLIANASVLNDIPGFLVHGRYDVVCPARSAWRLHKAWKNSELTYIPDAGHSVVEKGITQALLQIMHNLPDQLTIA